MHDQRIPGEIANDMSIVVMGSDQNPSDMGEKEAAFDVVGVTVRIGVAMMETVKSSPCHRGLFKRRSPKKENKQSNGPAGLEGRMGKQAMIAEVDRERAGQGVKRKERNLRPGHPV